MTTTPRHITLHSPAFLAERCEKMIDHAKRYIDLGIVIVKTHAPIFSETGEVGCTCEEYYRSDKCRDSGNKQYDPNYVCPNPGKHPVGKWKHETTGVTLDKIHDVWGRFHSALDVRTGKRVKIVWNIGKLTGPSNSLVFDEDGYKEHYQCDLSDLMTLDEQETPTQDTHSGGVHLVFDREDKPYTNANGELPKSGIFGVDIRGEQGFEVLAPSIGYTGNEYAWREGYEPWTIKARPIPKKLDAILRIAAEKRSKSPAAHVKFTAPTTEAPDLAKWRISRDTLDLIHNPRPKGQRSEADYSVCLSLCYAGATDDEILAVFEHNPIGIYGKFAEAGRVYLAHTISNARGYVVDHPRPDIGAIIDQCRILSEFADWSEIVPLNRQSEIGYMTGQTDRKLFDNLLDIMQRAGRIDGVIVSYRQLVGSRNIDGQRVAIASIQTAKNFLARVDGVLLTYTIGERGTTITLLPENAAIFNRTVCNRLDTSNKLPRMPEVSKVLQTGQINAITFCGYKSEDAFVSGCARWAREVIEAEKQILMRDNPLYQEAAIAYKLALVSKPETTMQLRALMGSELLSAYRELMARSAADFLPGLGTFGLLTIIDLLDNPGSCSKDIAVRRGLKVSSVRGALQKLARWELVESEQEFGAAKTYTLVDDVFGEIAEKMPEAKTHIIGIQRLDTRLQSDQAWAQKAANEAESEEERRLSEKRVNRLAEQRMATVPALHPDMDEDEVKRFVYTPHFVPAPAKPTAPDMPEPSALAWYRLTELTGKVELCEAELLELFALNDDLGAGIEFAPTLLWAHFQRWQADRQAATDVTKRLAASMAPVIFYATGDPTVPSPTPAQSSIWEGSTNA